MKLTLAEMGRVQREIESVCFASPRGLSLAQLGVVRGPNGKYYEFLPSRNDVESALAKANGRTTVTARPSFLGISIPATAMVPKWKAEREALRKGWVNDSGEPTGLGRCIDELHRKWPDVRKIDQGLRESKRLAFEAMTRWRFVYYGYWR